MRLSHCRSIFLQGSYIKTARDSGAEICPTANSSSGSSLSQSLCVCYHSCVHGGSPVVRQVIFHTPLRSLKVKEQLPQCSCGNKTPTHPVCRAGSQQKWIEAAQPTDRATYQPTAAGPAPNRRCHGADRADGGAAGAVG